MGPSAVYKLKKWGLEFVCLAHHGIFVFAEQMRYFKVGIVTSTLPRTP